MQRNRKVPTFPPIRLRLWEDSRKRREILERWESLKRAGEGGAQPCKNSTRFCSTRRRVVSILI